MTKNELAGFIMTSETAEQYYLRVIEAEKKMGPLSDNEKIVILKSLGTPLTLGELLDQISQKRILIIKQKEKNG